MFTNKCILITAGPTREPIDPVRFISNYSSGKMGIAIAEELAGRGGKVILIKGATSLSPQNKNITEIKVQTAAEMLTACTQYFTESDVVVFAAAVADYTPKFPAAQKIKKSEEEFSIELMKTKDIALELGKQKTAKQVLVGFALETNNEMTNAVSKLKKKNLDMIVLNSLQDAGAGFQHDTNKITIIDKNENVTTFDLKHKDEVAKDIVDFLEKLIK